MGMGDIDDDQERCNTGLALGIGVGEFMPKRKKQVVCLDLSFAIHPKEETITIDADDYKTEGSSSKTIEEDKDCLSHGASPRHDPPRFPRKLRLSKDQQTTLEESFKLNRTLNPAQKQILAETLNLRPRQVEVWFQNRRARTKLKQTEVDCEFLKKCCESLSNENRRLKKELQELKSLKLEHFHRPTPPPAPAPFYIQLPKAVTLTMCPSCEKIVNKDGTHVVAAATATPKKDDDEAKVEEEEEEGGGGGGAAATMVMDVVHHDSDN
ncbi:homeobox-leucine zipper protein HOX17-like [Diospyros lotus]|uniref:homeobox-leucine zipper protein HOX17-like n=1 Tax=Diospyros lotus TaxID=55363 RepID=UPI00224D8DFC|nr:homeobox-leucine zipper protein HOX17-like [Diospyros lotus]